MNKWKWNTRCEMECASVRVFVFEFELVRSLLANANNEPAGNDFVHDMMEYTFEWSLLCRMDDVCASQTGLCRHIDGFKCFSGAFCV